MAGGVVNLRAGTSGFSYAEWQPSFYPATVRKDGMLAYYGTQLPAVELNNTFYRLPRAEQCASWRGAVSDDFRFAVKASRAFTQSRKLRDCEDLLDHLYASLDELGPTLGCVFVQVPRFIRRDPGLLRAFLAAQPPGWRVAFEFVHEDWLDEEVYAVLREFDAALVHGDRDGAAVTELIDTGTWGYLRLRRSGYEDDDLRGFRRRIAATGWEQCFVFFKHEDSCAGPALARRFLALAP